MASRIEKHFKRLSVLETPKWPATWPFTPQNFQRGDESGDETFYDTPRFCYHIDADAVNALTRFYDALDVPSAVLDFASSWVSHFPEAWKKPGGPSRVAILGMNEEELRRNEVATERAVQNLNMDPRLPYESDSFDLITNCVSVDYLTKPLEVFREVRRCLRPGGRVVMSFSNRCFPTKVIDIWLRTSDLDHCFIVGCYFHYSGGFDPPEAFDISPTRRGLTDPVYVVTACKSNSQTV